MGLTAGAAGCVGYAVGGGHTYWAILTATIVINQWRDRVTTTRRAIDRAGGTALGLFVFWFLSILHLSTWWTVVAVVLCMIGHYLTFAVNYALTLVFITPMALLAIGASGTNAVVTEVTVDRLVDTLIGAGAAVAVTWATGRFFPRRLVRAQSIRTVAAIDALDAHTDTGNHFAQSTLRYHAELQYELTHHQSILNRAVADDPNLTEVAAEEQLVADRGYETLAHAWISAPQSSLDRTAKNADPHSQIS